MVDVNIEDGVAVFEVLGLDKLWALRSRLEVPLAHIRGVRADPTVTLSWKALRLPGTFVPGLIVAGTHYDGGRRSFWDVVRPQRAIVDLTGEPYDQLVVEVADPGAVAERLRAACRSPAA
jgi:hypothetical protein